MTKKEKEMFVDFNKILKVHLDGTRKALKESDFKLMHLHIKILGWLLVPYRLKLEDC